MTATECFKDIYCWCHLTLRQVRSVYLQLGPVCSIRSNRLTNSVHSVQSKCLQICKASDSLSDFLNLFPHGLRRHQDDAALVALQHLPASRAGRSFHRTSHSTVNKIPFMGHRVAVFDGRYRANAPSDLLGLVYSVYFQHNTLSVAETEQTSLICRSNTDM